MSYLQTVWPAARCACQAQLCDFTRTAFLRELVYSFVKEEWLLFQHFAGLHQKASELKKKKNDMKSFYQQ